MQDSELSIVGTLHLRRHSATPKQVMQLITQHIESKWGNFSILRRTHAEQRKFCADVCLALRTTPAFEQSS
jgi:hypothetical protein